MKKHLSVLVLSLAAAVGHANADTATSNKSKDNFELMASTTSYNRLVFPIPYQKIVVPNDAQLRETPISLKDNLGILIRPQAGARPIDLFVQLVDGQAFNIRLTPSASPDGAVFRYDNADDAQVKPYAVSRANDGWIADAFVLVSQDKKPIGFERSENKANMLPIKAMVRPGNAGGVYDEKSLNQIDLVPMRRYSGSGHTINVYRLHAKNMVNVEPRDFYRDGIVAVSIDGDVVGPKHNPLMIVLEDKHGQ